MQRSTSPVCWQSMRKNWNALKYNQATGLHNNGSLEMCLCKKCLDSFNQAGAYRIRRKSMHQKVFETCTYCKYRMGYDYIILHHVRRTQLHSVSAVCVSTAKTAHPLRPSSFPKRESRGGLPFRLWRVVRIAPVRRVGRALPLKLSADRFRQNGCRKAL